MSERHVLLIRFSSLGDVVLTTAVAEAIAAENPDVRVHMLTKSAWTGLFLGDARYTSVTGIRGGEAPSRIAGMTPRDRYDAVLDLHGSLRSRAVTHFIDAPLKRTVHKNALGRRLMVWSRNLVRRRFDSLDACLKTAEPLTRGERIMPRLVPSREHIARVTELLEDMGVAGRGLFGLAPGAKHPAKRWHDHSFAELGDRLSGERGFLPVFIGDGDDVPAIERIRGMMSSESVSLAGSLDLAGTVAFMSRLPGVVTNDSGPMHIAGALGIPFVTIFGPTHPDLGFCPGYSSGRVLHSGVQCSPCSIHGEKACRLGDRICMDRIGVDYVNGAVGDVLDSRG